MNPIISNPIKPTNNPSFMYFSTSLNNISMIINTPVPYMIDAIKKSVFTILILYLFCFIFQPAKNSTVIETSIIAIFPASPNKCQFENKIIEIPSPIRIAGCYKY